MSRSPTERTGNGLGSAHVIERYAHVLGVVPATTRDEGRALVLFYPGRNRHGGVYPRQESILRRSASDTDANDLDLHLCNFRPGCCFILYGCRRYREKIPGDVDVRTPSVPSTTKTAAVQTVYLTETEIETIDSCNPERH
jgi:hypothetical protein